MPPGLQVKNIKGLSEFKPRPLRMTAGSGIPGKPCRQSQLFSKKPATSMGNHKTPPRRHKMITR
jgi:hypothetical protein